ncbi:MAG TPA: hypothetical protein P5346_10445 [Spirochaetota bacterium]|nr:hypothetical protein [Spirochaetota bacterium]
MSQSPARIFIETGNFDEFREKIVSLNGEFMFDTDEMFRLGEAYFNRYPDSYSHRNSQEVLLGYEIARVCILEKILVDRDRHIKECLRSIIKDVSLVNPALQACVGEFGFEHVLSIHTSVMRIIDEIKFDIDRLPLGMVKERFIGGISIFYNISYIVKLALEAQKK